MTILKSSILNFSVLEEKGLIAEKGIIVDASFKEMPVQRNSKEENARIKNGEKMEEWSEDKRRQKDTDARWTKKTRGVILAITWREKPAKCSTTACYWGC